VDYDTKSGSHSIYALQYHLVWCTKYRELLMLPEARDALKEKIHDLFEQSGIDILNIEADADHVHVLFRGTPTVTLSRVVNKMKGATSKHLRSQFPELGARDHLWSPAYFLATTGQVTLDRLMEYVDEHAEEREA
jgi:putative transposase